MADQTTTKKYNKVVYAGQVLIDLTADTVTAEKLLSGYTAHDKSGTIITGTCNFDAYTSDATAVADEILNGKTAYVNGVKVTGKIPNNADWNTGIKDLLPISIPRGYHDGTGTVYLDPTEQAKIASENIREGITIFGVSGTMSGTEDAKAQNITVTPSTAQQTILPDSKEGYNYIAQVTVAAIPYTESSNDFGGITVSIG